MENKKNVNRTLLTLGLGLLAGGAAGYYLASDNGKKMRKKLKKQMTQINEQAREKISTELENFSEKLNVVKEKTQETIGALTKSASNQVEDLAEASLNVAETANSKFEKGIKKARNSMEKISGENNS